MSPTPSHDTRSWLGSAIGSKSPVSQTSTFQWNMEQESTTSSQRERERQNFAEQAARFAQRQAELVQMEADMVQREMEMGKAGSEQVKREVINKDDFENNDIKILGFGTLSAPPDSAPASKASTPSKSTIASKTTKTSLAPKPSKMFIASTVSETSKSSRTSEESASGLLASQVLKASQEASELSADKAKSSQPIPEDLDILSELVQKVGSKGSPTQYSEDDLATISKFVEKMKANGVSSEKEKALITKLVSKLKSAFESAPESEKQNELAPATSPVVTRSVSESLSAVSDDSTGTSSSSTNIELTNSDSLSIESRSSLCKSASGCCERINIFSCIARTWRTFCRLIHRALLCFVMTLSGIAAKNPILCITSIILVSIGVLAAGLFTNFTTSLDPEKVFTPYQSRAESHAIWINQQSGFPDTKVNPFYVLIHANGDSILTKDATGKLFDSLDAIRNTVGYNDVCAQGDHVDVVTGEITCWFTSATRHWNHNKTEFLNQVSSDQDVIDQMSSTEYPGGTRVALDTIVGKYEKDDDGNLLWAQSYAIYLKLPDLAVGVNDLEIALNEEMFKLRDKIRDDPDSDVQMEFSSPRSLQDEVVRALLKDLPLIPSVFLIMTFFTCMVFFRRHKVKSRWLLGYGAITTICLSIMTSFGIVFCFGIPFSVITQILPFIIFGIGLDDTFIITGSFFRTDPNKDPVERIHETMKDIGMSISLTTITTTVAFVLSSLSTIQAVRWLGIYAFSAIIVDFIYQITFFVALLVLDERRVQANRRDVCICIVAKDNAEENVDVNSKMKTRPVDVNISAADRFMVWYSKKLLTPSAKFLVLLLFTGYFGCCVWSTTQLTQEFKSEDFVPDDSYVRDFVDALDEYFTFATLTAVYFRNVDQSDPEIQQQMIDYVEEFTALEHAGIEPPFCWVKDFNVLQEMYGDQIANMPFNDQLDLALANPAIQEVYGGDIVRDAVSGNITASRCWVLLGGLNIGVVQEQIDFLKDQRALSASEPINEGLSDWSFFSFTQMYFVWEFYAAVEYELVFTTITGVVAVSMIGFILISHWSAVMFVFPLIVILYVDVLGTLQFFGLHINSMTFVCIIISIGLLVDFLMHVLLRYYESPGHTRDRKIQNALQTMGASIMVGGLSTFLGILPLAFSTSIIVRTVFFCFLAMVTLGCGHGLIFLPVVLSLIGPTAYIGEHSFVEATDSEIISDASSPSVVRSCDSKDKVAQDRLSMTSSPSSQSIAAVVSFRDEYGGIECRNDTKNDEQEMNAPSKSLRNEVSIRNEGGENPHYDVEIMMSPSGSRIDGVLRNNNSMV